MMTTEGVALGYYVCALQARFMEAYVGFLLNQATQSGPLSKKP